VNETDREQISKVLQTIEGIKYSQIYTRRVGPFSRVELTIEVPPTLTILEGQKIAGTVRKKILEHLPRAREVIVHIASNQHDIHPQPDQHDHQHDHQHDSHEHHEHDQQKRNH